MTSQEFEDFWKHYATPIEVPTLSGSKLISVQTDSRNMTIIRDSGTQATPSKEQCRKVCNLPSAKVLKGDSRYVEAARRAWESAKKGSRVTHGAVTPSAVPAVINSKAISTPVKIMPAMLTTPPTMATTKLPRLPLSPSRNDILTAFVDWIQNQPYQLYKITAKGTKVELIGLEIRGWDRRLKLFSYANNNKSSDYVADFALISLLLSSSDTLKKGLSKPGGWNSIDKGEALQVTSRIFKWGGVGRSISKWDEKTVEAVFQSAVSRTAIVGAPMNSSWTKVGAFASGRNGQVIWDSRVAVSIVWRLDKLLVKAGIASTILFPGIGFASTSPSGSRALRKYHLKWPPMYGKWDGQYAATGLVRELVKILNADPRKYPCMPIPDGHGGYKPVHWDVWGVGQVLFMDGY